MGVGMVVVVPSAHVKEVEADLKRRREKFFRIGRIERGDTGKARLVYSGALSL
jgi:phosphoribosylaminoimidazole (AIR) synthetase